VSLAVISPRLFAAVQDDLGTRIWPQLRSIWPLVDFHGLRDAFVIRYAVGEQEELRLHHDVAQVSASVKLNDDYDGAVLEFPRQDVSNASVPVGSMLVWPSLVTHPHRSTPISRGVKHSLTVWFEIPEHYA
jgi:predicted 2-oxoglutarate/Fe(II)-dependent dioxygenase YbiX